MRRTFSVFRILFLVAVNLFFVTVSPALSVLAAGLAEGTTWSYAVKLNGQLFGLAKASVVGREEIDGEIIWVIKDEQFYRFFSKNSKELRAETRIEIRDDFTLKRFERTIVWDEGEFSSQLEETEDGYVYSSYNPAEGETSRKSITTQSPLPLCYFGLPWNYPWLFELLVKNEILTTERPCHVLSFPSEIIKVEYLGSSSPDPEHNEVYCYLAESKRIYVNKNQNVIRIDIEPHGTIEFIPGEGLSEEEIPGYDVAQVFDMSSIPLLKPGDLTSLTVYINMEQGFKNVDYLQTPSARQRFVGTVNGRIEGEVTITRTPAEIAGPINPFPFPVTTAWGPEFTKYLESHPLVEADAPEIIAQAQVITKTATNAWEAAQSIARWVRQNIEYDNSYENLSALGTLNEKKGVCSQFAFLTAALCRAVNIPTRVVVGFVYDMSFFAPHAWVEVYTDEAGWRAMDPTNRQFAFVDLTHIGFSDELQIGYSISGLKTGNVKIKILDFLPKEAGSAPPPPLDISRFKIYGKELRYEIFTGKHKDGEYTACLQAVEDGGFCLLESVELPSLDGFQARSELSMDRQGYALKYSESGIVLLHVKREREFLFNEVIQYRFRQGVREEEKEIARVFPDEIQVDLYKFLQWGLLAARLAEDVEEEAVKIITVFDADTQTHNNLKATIRPCKVEYGGSMVDGWFCAISGVRYEHELYLTEDGVLTRVEIPELEMRAVLVE